MNELVIQDTKFSNNKVQTVDARQLHDFLGSKKKFADWIKNKVINNPFFEQDVDFIALHQSVKRTGRGGQNRKDYALTIDTAKKVSMAEQTEAGNRARDYFLECEKVAKGESPPVPELPKTFAEALRLAADLEEEKQALLAKVEADEPHVTFSKRIETSTGAIMIGDFAKVLTNAGIKIGRTRLFEYLRKKGYIMKNSTKPYQKYIENKYFEVKEKVYWSTKEDEYVPYTVTMITGRGQKTILENWEW